MIFQNKNRFIFEKKNDIKILFFNRKIYKFVITKFKTLNISYNNMKNDDKCFNI